MHRDKKLCPRSWGAPWKMPRRAKRSRASANFPEGVNRAVNLIYANICPLSKRLKVLRLESHQVVTDSPVFVAKLWPRGPDFIPRKNARTAFRNEAARIIIRHVPHSRWAPLNFTVPSDLHACRNFRWNYAQVKSTAIIHASDLPLHTAPHPVIPFRLLLPVWQVYCAVSCSGTIGGFLDDSGESAECYGFRWFVKCRWSLGWKLVWLQEWLKEFVCYCFRVILKY